MSPVQWSEELLAVTASRRRAVMDEKGYEEEGEEEEHLMKSEMLSIRAREYKRRKKEIDNRPLAVPRREAPEDDDLEEEGNLWRDGRSPVSTSTLDPMLQQITKDEEELICGGRFQENMEFGSIDVEPEGSTNTQKHSIDVEPEACTNTGHFYPLHHRASVTGNTQLPIRKRCVNLLTEGTEERSGPEKCGEALDSA